MLSLGGTYRKAYSRLRRQTKLAALMATAIMAIMNKWVLLFLLTPLVEMYMLIEVGSRIGAWPTIGLVVLTAVIGVALLKRQGLRTLRSAQDRLAGGEVPAAEVVEGLLLAVAGALLLTPGFATDAAGFLALVPAVRARVARRVLNSFAPELGGVAEGRTFEGNSTRL